MIKIDLHMHTGEDPKDGIAYPATTLIDKAAALGFAAIAITLHRQVLEDTRVFDYARDKGVLLIPAVEWTIHRRDVLLYNIHQRDAETLHSFDDLRAYRQQRGDDLLVVAPHPHYPVGHSLGKELQRNLDVFDAIEHAQIHLPWYNPNQSAVALARQHQIPVIANSDSHALWMFGRHYTWADAEPTIPSIFRAIREGRVEIVSPPVTLGECWRMFFFDPVFHRKKGRIVRSFE